VWYVIGYSRKYDTFYGYANLNDLDNAEWGIIDREEMGTTFHGSRKLAMQRWLFSMYHTFIDGPISIADIPHRATDMLRII
jgi:hypothetical protein